MGDCYRRSTKIDFNEGAQPNPATASLVVNAALAWCDKRVLMAGGYNGPTGHSTTQVLEYDCGTKQWTNYSATLALPEPRSEATMVCVGSTFYLFGGYNDRKVLGSMLKLTLPAGEGAKGATGTWEVVECQQKPSARRGHSIALMPVEGDEEPKFYVFGGFDGTKRLDDLWEFNAATSTWSCLSCEGTGPTPRDSCALVADANSEKRLLVFGGYTNSRVNDIFSLNLATMTWTQYSADGAPSPRMGCFGAANGTYAVFGLGQDCKGPTAMVCQLNHEKKWTVSTPEGDELEANTQFSWTVADGGKKVYVYGGFNEKRYSNVLYEIELERSEPQAAAKKK